MYAEGQILEHTTFLAINGYHLSCFIYCVYPLIMARIKLNEKKILFCLTIRPSYT